MAFDPQHGAGRLLNQYRIVSLLSTSATGDVFLARDTLLDRAVALRTLPSETSGEAARAFVHKARAASSLAHPNVAEIYAVSEAGGVRFLAMEYVEGQTLAARLAAGPLRWSQIATTAAEAAHALIAAHAKGITHGALGADSIMLTPGGHVKVLDFGVSWLGRGRGAGPHDDASADIAALGAVLQRMIGAKRGAPAEDEKSFPAASRAELERIASRCLESDPERRYPSARDLLNDLIPLQRHAPARWSLPQWAVGALLMSALAIIAFTTLSTRGPGGRIDSVAVLPLESGDPALEFLSHGISEQLIRSLGLIPGLKVIAPETVFTYRGQPLDVRRTGEDLGVRAVATGRVGQAGDRLSVEVALTDARDGSELWRQQYTRGVSELQQIEEAIAKEISARLRPRPSGAELARIARNYGGSSEAHARYLRGRYLFHRGGAAALAQSLDEFRAVVASEPAYALGHSGLADSYVSMAHLGADAPHNILPAAGRAAEQALKLDADLAEAHAALGVVRLYWEWNWTRAEKEFREAVRLSPGSADLRHWLAHYLEAAGRLEDATREMRVALALDPRSKMYQTDLFLALVAQRQYDQALSHGRNMAAAAGGDATVYLLLGDLYRRMGNSAQSRAEFAKIPPALGRTPYAQTLLGIANASLGRRAEARRCLDEIEQLAATRYVSPLWLAALRLHLGDQAAGYAWLDRAVEARATELTTLARVLLLPDLSAVPRYQSLLKRIGVPQR